MEYTQKVRKFDLASQSIQNKYMCKKQQDKIVRLI
jgi:hypothetical protein